MLSFEVTWSQRTRGTDDIRHDALVQYKNRGGDSAILLPCAAICPFSRFPSSPPARHCRSHPRSPLPPRRRLSLRAHPGHPPELDRPAAGLRAHRLQRAGPGPARAGRPALRELHAPRTGRLSPRDRSTPDRPGRSPAFQTGRAAVREGAPGPGDRLLPPAARDPRLRPLPRLPRNFRGMRLKAREQGRRWRVLQQQRPQEDCRRSRQRGFPVLPGVRAGRLRGGQRRRLEGDDARRARV